MNKRDFQEIKQKFEKESKKKKLSRLLSFFTTFLSILGITVISYYFISNLKLDRVENNSTESVIKQIKLQNSSLKEELKSLQLKFENQTVDSLKMNDFGEIRIQNLENKLESLERIIMESPEKALSIPFLSKEIENQKINNENKIELIKDKITTVVDLNKWILGLIFSLLITIVISNLFGFNQKKSNKSDEEEKTTGNTI